jgi:small subunit ribosomal protein S6
MALNKYEGMFLLDNGKIKSEVQKGIDAIAEVLKKHNANVVKIGKWDERKLAYEIRNQKRGTYVLAHFEAPPEAIDEIKNEMNLSEIISRHLLVRLRTKFPPFMTAQEIDAAFGQKEGREREPRSFGGRRSRGDEAGVAAGGDDMGGAPGGERERRPRQDTM